MTEYNLELSKRTVLLNLNFVDSNKKVQKNEAILLEIATLTSDEFDAIAQFDSNNQCFRVKTTVALDKGRTVVNESDEIHDNVYHLPAIQLPKFSEYEIDTSKITDISLDNKNDRVHILQGQDLWLPNEVDPESGSRTDEGFLKRIDGNMNIDIFLKAHDVINEINVEQKNPLSRIAQFDNKINNDDLFNTVDSFTEFENNLFFLCIAQFYNSSSKILRFSSKQIKELVGYNRHINNAQFVKMIDDAFKKYLSIQEVVVGTNPETNEPYTERKNLFSIGRIYHDSLECEIQVNEAFEELFNNLKMWTRFSIIDYARIRSSYSKKLFRLLKGFRTTGVRTFTLDKFRELLHVPESYTVANINQKIIQSCMIDLAPYFKHLSVKKNRDGRKISGWTFSWTPETNLQSAISKNKLLDETWAIHNIKTNHWLNQSQKFESIDKYRGYKKGTTKKAYSHAHPNTYFFDAEAKKEANSEFTRLTLNQVYAMTMLNLKELIEEYENYNWEGTLQKGDQDDLFKLEKIYTERQLKFSMKSAGSEKPNVPSRDIIAGRSIYKHFVFKKGYGLFADDDEIKIKLPVVLDEIQQEIINHWAKKVESQDHRPPELK